MKRISTIVPSRMICSFLLLAILLATPASALSCACCAEPGTWFQIVGRADPEVLALTGELGDKLGPTALLQLGAADLEEVKGISSASERYVLQRLGRGRQWKLRFTAQDGKDGTLNFTIPDAVVDYGVDLRENHQMGAGGPQLYKEWRFEGPVTGTGIFESGSSLGARFRLIFQGRGNMCRNAGDFKHWILQIKGPGADYTLYGSIGPRPH